jgi:potassium/chloride transporter 8
MMDIVLFHIYHTFSNMLFLLLPVSVALVSVLSAVGICERCRVESGGVYFLVSHVLGSKFGGALGLLYVFGQVSIISAVADKSESLASVTENFLTSL